MQLSENVWESPQDGCKLAHLRVSHLKLGGLPFFYAFLIYLNMF